MAFENLLKKQVLNRSRLDVLRRLMGGDRTINRNEQMSLLSLLAYTAIETETPVEEMQNAFFDHFDIDRVEDLKSDEYDDAVSFVMEWKGKGAVAGATRAA